MTLREKVLDEIGQAIRDVMTGLYDEKAIVPLVGDRILALFERSAVERERAAWESGHYEGYDLGIYDESHMMVNYPATQKWANAEAARRYPLPQKEASHDK